MLLDTPKKEVVQHFVNRHLDMYLPSPINELLLGTTASKALNAISETSRKSSSSSGLQIGGSAGEKAIFKTLTEPILPQGDRMEVDDRVGEDGEQMRVKGDTAKDEQEDEQEEERLVKVENEGQGTENEPGRHNDEEDMTFMADHMVKVELNHDQDDEDQDEEHQPAMAVRRRTMESVMEEEEGE